MTLNSRTRKTIQGCAGTRHKGRIVSGPAYCRILFAGQSIYSSLYSLRFLLPIGNDDSENILCLSKCPKKTKLNPVHTSHKLGRITGHISKIFLSPNCREHVRELFPGARGDAGFNDGRGEASSVPGNRARPMLSAEPSKRMIRRLVSTLSRQNQCDLNLPRTPTNFPYTTKCLSPSSNASSSGSSSSSIRRSTVMHHTFSTHFFSVTARSWKSTQRCVYYRTEGGHAVRFRYQLCRLSASGGGCFSFVSRLFLTGLRTRIANLLPSRGSHQAHPFWRDSIVISYLCCTCLVCAICQ